MFQIKCTIFSYLLEMWEIHRLFFLQEESCKLSTMSSRLIFDKLYILLRDVTVKIKNRISNPILRGLLESRRFLDQIKKTIKRLTKFNLFFPISQFFVQCVKVHLCCGIKVLALVVFDNMVITVKY